MNLWYQFNLAENNPDPGGGILRCMSYSPERITAHREHVIQALQRRGISLEDLGEGIGVFPAQPEDPEGVLLLLEELSVHNEALEYHENGFGQYATFDELMGGVVSTYFGLITERNLQDAYNLVSMAVPQIVKDIFQTERRSPFLSAKEKVCLEDLSSFGERQVRNLNRPSVLLG